MTGLIPLDSSEREATVDEPAVEAAAAADDVDAVRALILRTHADIVPELISGPTVDALIASIAPAREAYARIATQVGQGTTVAPAVPAGGTGRALIDPAQISAPEKIRRGLANRDA